MYEKAVELDPRFGLAYAELSEAQALMWWFRSDRTSERVDKARGRVVARLAADGDAEAKPWLRLRGTARWMGEPLKPAIGESEVESLK